MTIIAGILGLSRSYRIEDSTCDSIKQLLSRNPNDEAVTFRDDRCFLAKVDINAYGEPSFRVDPSGSVAVLSGEPLLALHDGCWWQTRTRDLELLHHEWDVGKWDLLKKARGVFCAVHYHPMSGKLTLIADKLGLRSLYYWLGTDCVIFATALRILEALPCVTKQMDLRAVTEMAALGFPLSARTPYAGVSLLKPAEMAQFSENRKSTFQYWRWDQLGTSKKSELEQLEECYHRFRLGVSNRLRNDKVTVGWLSGGLDSRCITAMLRSLDVIVHTFNFAFPGAQDRVFASEFASKIGTIHSEVQVSEMSTPAEWVATAVSGWNSSKHRGRWPADRPLLIWSGDGGSVGLGHVYLSKKVVDRLRASSREDAINAFLQEQNVAVLRRLLNAKISDSLAKKPLEGICEELENIHCDDPGRALHLFLMFNDQRRHLTWFYENIDLLRIEYHLPFFDSDFLEAVLKVPIDFCLHHHFYGKLLKHFPPAVLAVPWQAYPGHEPCPIPIPAGLSYQWDKNVSTKGANRLRQIYLKQAYEIINTKQFPHPIANRWYLRLVTWAYQAGLADYSYVIKVASTYHKYWTICGGKFIFT